MFVDGIEKLETDFDYINKQDVNFSISYDQNIITEDKIKELEKKMNEY